MIFVDAHASAHAQLESLALQASLLAAGSLDREILRGLGRARVARRYLAVEGHRALASVEAWLPPSLASLKRADVAARSASPAASLAVARRQ